MEAKGSNDVASITYTCPLSPISGGEYAHTIFLKEQDVVGEGDRGNGSTNVK